MTHLSLAVLIRPMSTCMPLIRQGAKSLPCLYLLLVPQQAQQVVQMPKALDAYSPASLISR